ncbi:hypothetical protein B0H63DRAFT_517966 [Podospora didyma]|uniref:AMP-activated protein kinase glycogen-binding domain-containing protein n=1 Tax=Podospora didyma TaxID=330526 RepID=A0AAE0P7N6_9PEZI|nr:hypothetical protein B0H63DRAFT_517966 [Podospora didyma]
MGTFTFQWPHAAEEVYVTGTFDNWSKSEQLTKVGDVFEKKVTLPETSEKVYYKFVVDGDWITDHAAPQEKDPQGNENNFLLPEQMATEQETGSAAAILNSIAPESTTAQLAGAVPLEEPKEEPSVSGAYPETPAADLDTKEFKVSPLPAADGAVNPIKLEPGAKIPEGIATEGINSHVTLDKESYEKSDRIPGLETELPAITSNMIPESSLPVLGANDVAINSAAPTSTTAALAGAVPLEPKVPEIVKQSQEEAKVDPEASAVSEEVKEKAAVEDELLEKVPEAPSTSEGTSGKGTEKSETDKTVAETVTAAAATAGAAVLGAAIAFKQTATAAATDAASSLPDFKQTATATAATAKQTASDAAATVQQTATDAATGVQQSATAATTTVAVSLPESVTKVLPTSVQEAVTAAKQEAIVESIAPEVPAEVKESIKEAGSSPEAATSTTAVEEKKEVEAQLLKEVKPVEAVAESSAKAAEATPSVVELVDTKPTEEVKPEEAKPEGAKPVEIKAVEEPKPEEVKPVVIDPVGETKPVETKTEAVKPATNGASTAAATTEPAVVPTPAADGAAASTSKATDSPVTTDKKKKNRLSAMFTKLKQKVGGKDKA